MKHKIFEHYSYFCATFAMEVFVCYCTMVVGAISLNISSPYEFCEWAMNCSKEMQEPTSDAVLLTLLRCSAILYVYYQLKKVWKFSSAFVAAILCFYCVLSVTVFSITIFHFLRKDIVIVSNALPVFLLVSNISPTVVLAQHCLSLVSIDQLQEYISKGMGTLMPIVSLDAIVQLLLFINVGGYFQIRQLQQLSCFACISVIINYIVFSTFVPACLSLYLNMTNKNSFNDQCQPSWHDTRFVGILTKLSEQNCWLSPKSKVFVCLSLLGLHLTRLSVFHVYLNSKADLLQNIFDSILTLSPEGLFTAVLIMVICGRYLFDDYEMMSKLCRRSNELNPPNEVDLVDKIENEVEFENSSTDESYSVEERTPEKCLELLAIGSDLVTDEEILLLIKLGKIQAHRLERILCDANRGVLIRRKLLKNCMENNIAKDALNLIPHLGYDFTTATKACCENTVGYIPVPIGIVGPLLLNEKKYKVPMATTEGTLLASTNRGLKALLHSGGVTASVYADGMTRAPVVSFPSITRCAEVSSWLKDKYNFNLVKEKFDETSCYAKLKEIKPKLSGRLLFIRFTALTGDAMGMNMVSKGAENALKWLQNHFPDMKVISLSGNFCTDKKPSAVNWIEGRGKSVVCEAMLPQKVVEEILRTNIDSLVYLNHCKNHVGSAMCGSIGGFNAHAANIVTAIFIATGQDPAQNVVSSNCITSLQTIADSDKVSEPTLLVTCTMPSLEVATVGGGAALEPQKACLNILGVAGSSSPELKPGSNACELAEIICATVMAGELSLMSALSTGDLVQSHMKHNRLKPTVVQEAEHNIL